MFHVEQGRTDVNDTQPRCEECSIRTSKAATVLQAITVADDTRHEVPAVARCDHHAGQFRRNICDLTTITLHETRIV